MRRWIKVRLGKRDTAEHAASIVQGWREERVAAGNVENAVRLYHELLHGDVTLLGELFPFLTKTLAQERPARRPIQEALKIEYVEPGADDITADFAASLGLDDIEF